MNADGNGIASRRSFSVSNFHWTLEHSNKQCFLNVTGRFVNVPKIESSLVISGITAFPGQQLRGVNDSPELLQRSSRIFQTTVNFPLSLCR